MQKVVDTVSGSSSGMNRACEFPIKVEFVKGGAGPEVDFSEGVLRRGRIA